MGCIHSSKPLEPVDAEGVKDSGASSSAAAAPSVPAVTAPVSKAVSDPPAATTGPSGPPPETESNQAQAIASTASGSGTMTKVYIVYYSMYGHIAKMAEKVKEGAESVEGVEAKLWQVPETLSEEILGKMHAPPKSDVPIITPAELKEADAIIFGFPTRFGMMAGQMKSFFDATGSLWQSQALAGKLAGIFVSTATQGGGQETTALTAITQLTHHGMIFVPMGYTYGADMFSLSEVKGGSPYGPGTLAAGDGSRQPSESELGYAKHQGSYIAKIAKKLSAP